MPLGVPKVPFLFREEEEASWVELYNVIYRCGLLFLGDEIDSETTNDIGGLMVFLHIQNPKKDIHLLINSPGGEMISGLAIFDIMQVIQPAVHTLCVGIAASMASLLLIGGQINKREAFPHARIMIHQPLSGSFDSPAGDGLLDTGELMDLRQTVAEIYAEKTGKPLWKISEDLSRDSFMTPEEAQAYGIIDKLADLNSI
uniref:ATP-dependent Clp protease proteolytic subunit n=1 Tax=Hedysarum citrinum TaxID=1641281 RepID=UPI002A836BDB|nr:ATP-dependent Clp protease proteolytic subunit [Hedysarum citrinum]WNM89294.1 ATP-dependent Clp protease proteolytic subunit [Hedysarum citrinum]